MKNLADGEMTPRIRLVFLAGGITLGVALAAYGLQSFSAWRRAELSNAPASPDTQRGASPSPAGSVSAGEDARRVPLVGDGPSPAPLLPPARPDRDEDGLPDNLEEIYHTNPLKKDTDNDGYLDGSEVANGFDPTVAGPDDKIAQPPPTPAAPTFTQQYFDKVGLPPSRENLLKPEELDAFIASVNARGFLSAVTDEELNIVSRAGKPAVAAYLDAVSLPQNKEITPVRAEDIDAAFRMLTEKKDGKPLDDLIAALAKNAEILRGAPVPGEALALHKQYLAATLALKANVESLKGYQADFVGALVAASRIDNLRGVFRAIAEGVKELEKQYGIT